MVRGYRRRHRVVFVKGRLQSLVMKKSGHYLVVFFYFFITKTTMKTMKIL